MKEEKYLKFDNGGEKCDLCDYVGEHYCAKRPISNPLLTLIEQADKEFSELRIKSVIVADKDFDTHEHEESPQIISSHIHQLLLSIAKGEVARLEGMKYKKPGYYSWTQSQYDEAQAGKMAEWAKKRRVGEECFSGEMEEFEKPYNQALSDSLEHWQEIISYLEKK